MKFHGTMTQNDQGLISIGGVDVMTLKKEYGTPLYIYDESLLEENIVSFQKSFSHNNLKGTIAYASKAFLTIAMAQLINNYELSIDVASGGELYTVYQAGFDMSRVYFHGNNKTNEELNLAVKLNCGHIILDNESEVSRLIDILEKQDKTMKVMLRVNPGIDVLTHDFIKTSKLDSKFGLDLEAKETMDLIRKIKSHQRLDLIGLHAHIGSQIHQTEPFFENVRSLLKVYQQLKAEKIHFDAVNLGGGFGVYYTEEDQPIHLEIFLKDLINYVQEVAIEYQLDLKEVIIEPGRSLVANAGSTLYTVGSSKLTPSKKEYVFVDGGMSDNPRVALYDAKYEAIIANHQKGEIKPYTIAGKLCESGDVLSKCSYLYEPKADDLLLMTSTGAYTFSMSSNYNRMMRPAVVFVKNGTHRLIVKRQTLDDLIQGDLPL